MIFGSSTQDTRPLFFASWQKHQSREILTPLEQQLVRVLEDHAEYQPLFGHSVEAGLEQIEGWTSRFVSTDISTQGVEYERPFLHMGLHLTIRDQILLDKPAGIAAVYRVLYQRYQNQHQVEHMMMAPLAACLWEANRRQMMPDEAAFLRACQELLER